MNTIMSWVRKRLRRGGRRRLVIGRLRGVADRRRDALKRELGDDLGQFVADIWQYGAAWTGDVWEWTAIGAERHIAFATIPERHPWDHSNAGYFVVSTEGTDGGRWDGLWGWGGMRKPHKNPQPNADGMIEVACARFNLEPEEDGLYHAITMPKGSL